MWKNIVEQDTDDNVVHMQCMLDTYGYKHTVRICNTHCFSTATMVARKRLNVTLHFIIILKPCNLYLLYAYVPTKLHLNLLN